MGGSEKYSVGSPEELAETVRARVGPGGFSAFVPDAIEHRIAMERLGEIVADFEADNGPLTGQEVEAARAVLNHDRSPGP
ncbi:hypothetical protein O4J56_09995 [Nocardiopsis sp. RSe5-2]|uniref:CopG family transcriptional regulator n=1 Tax=Nocardiopsis endophytica TaxID=3018445 RepID=A0ABT4U2Q7_9ACTN|nr:hypothetical protein [Nocardiopsis endophytica]MDA2810966.1 hypothetical protein [Nocardiopsis endophytica]